MAANTIETWHRCSGAGKDGSWMDGLEYIECPRHQAGGREGLREKKPLLYADCTARTHVQPCLAESVLGPRRIPRLEIDDRARAFAEQRIANLRGRFRIGPGEPQVSVTSAE